VRFLLHARIIQIYIRKRGNGEEENEDSEEEDAHIEYY
jgi:hypothetical protein